MSQVHVASEVTNRFRGISFSLRRFLDEIYRTFPEPMDGAEYGAFKAQQLYYQQLVESHQLCLMAWNLGVQIDDVYDKIVALTLLHNLPLKIEELSLRLERISAQKSHVLSESERKQAVAFFIADLKLLHRQVLRFYELLSRHEAELLKEHIHPEEQLLFEQAMTLYNQQLKNFIHEKVIQAYPLLVGARSMMGAKRVKQSPEIELPDTLRGLLELYSLESTLIHVIQAETPKLLQLAIEQENDEQLAVIAAQFKAFDAALLSGNLDEENARSIAFALLYLEHEALNKGQLSNVEVVYQVGKRAWFKKMLSHTCFSGLDVEKSISNLSRFLEMKQDPKSVHVKELIRINLSRPTSSLGRKR